MQFGILAWNPDQSKSGAAIASREGPRARDFRRLHKTRFAKTAAWRTVASFILCLPSLKNLIRNQQRHSNQKPMMLFKSHFLPVLNPSLWRGAPIKRGWNLGEVFSTDYKSMHFQRLLSFFRTELELTRLDDFSTL